MKRLKDSLEHLDNPSCPNCQIAMRWFRSELVRDNPTTMIAHLFVCPNCKRAHRQDTDFTPVIVPPDKLAGSRLQVIDGESAPPESSTIHTAEDVPTIHHREELELRPSRLVSSDYLRTA